MAAEAKPTHVSVYRDDHRLVRLLATHKEVSTAQVVRELIAAAMPNLPARDRRFLDAVATISD